MKRKLLVRLEVNQVLKTTVFLILIIIILFFLVDINLAKDTYNIVFFDNNNISTEIFLVAWGMNITIVLFAIELGNEYYYGISLKDIIHWSNFDKYLIYAACEYFLLCPIYYICYHKGWHLVCVWCIICAFGGTAVVLLYIVLNTRKSAILKMIKKEAIKQLKTVQGENYKPLFFTKSIVDQMAITSMIGHIDCTNNADVEAVITIINEVLQDLQIMKIAVSKAFNHLLIMTWINQIIEKSGIETEFQKKRTRYILLKLWKNISENINRINKNEETKSKISVEKMHILYAVEFLIPFIERLDESKNQILWELWARMGMYHRSVLPYLLLYMEFTHSYYSFNNLNIRFLKNSYTKQALISICQGQVGWNTKLAMEFWLSWINYDGESVYLAAIPIGHFDNDLKNISDKKNIKVKTYIMKYICLEGDLL